MIGNWCNGSECLWAGSLEITACLVWYLEMNHSHVIPSPYRFIIHANVTSNFEQIGEERALGAFLSV
jgi:hypothetical protein